MLAKAAQSDGGLTVGWLVKLGLVVIAALVVIGIVVWLSLLFWRFLIWAFFGGPKRALLSTSTISAGLYFDVVNPIELFWRFDEAWGQSRLVAVIGMFVTAGPIYMIYLFCTGESLSLAGGRPSTGNWGSAPASPAPEAPSSPHASNGDWPAPSEPLTNFDSRYGPQQGTSTLADQPGSIYGDGPQQGFKTPADEPGGLYSDGPQY